MIISAQFFVPCNAIKCKVGDVYSDIVMLHWHALEAAHPCPTRMYTDMCIILGDTMSRTSNMLWIQGRPHDRIDWDGAAGTNHMISKLTREEEKKKIFQNR